MQGRFAHASERIRSGHIGDSFACIVNMMVVYEKVVYASFTFRLPYRLPLSFAIADLENPSLILIPPRGREYGQ